ncbi:hypothetical protein J5N97_003937 [Dioscorea zingiberensis]|uniref:Uncharacterized protein n=1 Tax=Dioscorea zingiberensis TaxID=325984 RepID=A0A9D5BTV0_9LILI|nr:hypothetical protein J5N97_001641 [Dioscorea zingiberensis]KAJ0985581.1 hypothetical protein J5N97_003937 [Dioscorea zingiberensis]
MLLAVEGGGFFSSSATGYSKGLSLLLLGQKNEERPMRVLPWNQYQLVDQEVDSDLQLASRKKQASQGCTSFLCFGRASTELDGPCPPKASPAKPPEALPITCPASDDSKIGTNISVDVSETKICRKSSLKKNSRDCSAMVGASENACNSLEDVPGSEVCSAERRKVHWTDASGMELAEVREFEVSNEGHASDEEFEDDGERRCQCVVQ